MTYRVLSRAGGRRETRHINLPVVPWGGGYFGWGYSASLGLPEWDVKDHYEYSPRLVWAPAHFKQIALLSGGALAQGADNRLYYWGIFSHLPWQSQPALHPFDPKEPVKICVCDGVFSGAPVFLIGLDSKRVWCHGTNDHGQLGVGIDDFSFAAEGFIEVPALRGFSQIGVAAIGRSVASRSIFHRLCVYGVFGNDVYFWGDPVDGGPAAPAFFQRFPFPVVQTAFVRTFRACHGNVSTFATFFILSNGDVFFLGTSDSGAALGIGHHPTQALFPLTKHAGISGVKKIIVLPPVFINMNFAESRCIALKSDGTVWCWGYITHYADGTARDEFVYVPMRVHGLPEVVDIIESADVVFALSASGDVWTWGGRAQFDDALRGLGQGAAVTVPPQKIPGLPEIVGLGAPSQLVNSVTFALPKTPVFVKTPVRPVNPVTPGEPGEEEWVM